MKSTHSFHGHKPRERVSGASERVSGRANGLVLYTSAGLPDSWSPCSPKPDLHDGGLVYGVYKKAFAEVQLMITDRI